MSDRFAFEPVGEEVLLTRLNQAIASLERPGKLYGAIGAQLEENINLRITTTKADPSGKPWLPVSPLTPIIYERITGRKWDGSLLRRTGHMLDTLAHNATDQGVEVGFSAPYAIFHETGTQRDGEPYMPRRGLLMADPATGTLGAEDREDVQAIIEGYLARALGQ